MNIQISQNSFNSKYNTVFAIACLPNQLNHRQQVHVREHLINQGFLCWSQVIHNHISERSSGIKQRLSQAYCYKAGNVTGVTWNSFPNVQAN